MKQFLSVFALLLQLSVPGQDTALHHPFTSTNAGEPAVSEWKVSVQQEKIRFNWKVEANQVVDMFELEQSTDGRSWKVAAIVFGTDTQMNNLYSFFVKNPGKKTWYRLKLITKEKQTSYSEVISAGV